MNLEELWVKLRYGWGTRRLRRQMRTFLPVLRCFSFIGRSIYVEELVTWIDAPLLERLVINLFEEPEYDTPQLVRLISCMPMFEAPIEARVFFDDVSGRAILPLRNGQLAPKPSRLTSDHSDAGSIRYFLVWH